MRHWPAHFAVVHKAALANDMLRYRPELEYRVDEAAECGSAASLNLSDSTHDVRARGCSGASRDRFFRGQAIADPFSNRYDYLLCPRQCVT